MKSSPAGKKIHFYPLHKNVLSILSSEKLFEQSNTPTPRPKIFLSIDIGTGVLLNCICRFILVFVDTTKAQAEQNKFEIKIIQEVRRADRNKKNLIFTSPQAYPQNDHLL